jgi:UDP-N-acetylmuramoyl-tripeptide--D-alanyl-D-alanine ligase
MAVTSGTAPHLLVGLGEESHFRAVRVLEHGLDGVSFLLHAEGRQIPLETQVPGRHVIHAFLAAAAIARWMGLEWTEIQQAVAEARVDIRQRLLRGLSGMLIIDDSYNAAPASMKAALGLLESSPGGHVAVLGDMLELGSGEADAHAQVGIEAARVADWLVVLGPRAAWIAESAERAGLSRSRIMRVGSKRGAARSVLDIVARPVTVGASHTPTMPSDPARHRADAPIQWSVLVKGSRGMEMEEVVDILRGQV